MPTQDELILDLFEETARRVHFSTIRSLGKFSEASSPSR